MKRAVVYTLSALALTACANNPSLKNAAMSTPGFMDQDQTIQAQRPDLPVTHFVKWSQSDRLEGSIVVDYVSGMSQRSYFFEEPNQSLYRPMLDYALAKTELKAEMKSNARYALQIEFHELESEQFGRDFAGKSMATYRVTDRKTGEMVYQKRIGSNFIAAYPGINEGDAETAYAISAPGMFGAAIGMGAFAVGDGVIGEAISSNSRLTDFFGDYDEASQATWNDAYQSYFWTTGVSALAGPVVVVAEQLNPFNYVGLSPAINPSPRNGAQARRGQFSTSGLGSRNAAERARQVNAQILSQSITVFLLDLAKSEDVAMTELVSCKSSESTEEVVEAIRSKRNVISDDCNAYRKPSTNRGLGIATWN